MSQQLNSDAIGNLLNALQSLMAVPNTGLEQTAIKRKIEALSTANTEGLEGKALIDVMGDEQLAIAIADGDKRIGLEPHPDPFIWNHIRNTRPKALQIYANLHQARGSYFSGSAKNLCV
jgi:beta-phosphoglucomutase-like phosphatase (HAD superfamily)